MESAWFYENNSIAKHEHALTDFYFPSHLPRVWQLWLQGESTTTSKLFSLTTNTLLVSGKNEKLALRRKAHNYKVNRSVLFYLLKENWRQVPCTNKDQQRILEACHALPEGRPGKWGTGCPVQQRFTRQVAFFIACDMKICIYVTGGHLWRDNTYF